MNQVSAINVLEVPEGFEDEAIAVRERYVAYFKQQPGFVSATFYQSINAENRYNFINIVVWVSEQAYQAVVKGAAMHAEGENADGMKVLGRGFPEPILVNPGQYKIIGGS